MKGILILGFLAVFCYMLRRNMKTMSRYREQIVHASQLVAQHSQSIEQRTQDMETLDQVEHWNEFDIRTIYPELPEYRTRGHQFLGPLRHESESGEVHVFDWYFAAALRQGFRMTWFQTIISFELEDQLLPSFNLRPRDLPLGVAIPGFEVIDIDGLDPNYQLDGASSYTIRRIFDVPGMLNALNAFLSTDAWHIDRYEDKLSISAFNQLRAPHDIPARIEEAESIVVFLQTAARNADASLNERLAVVASDHQVVGIR